MTRRSVILKSQTPPIFKGLSPRFRRIFNGLLLLGACLLVGNAVVGEDGLVDSLEARRQHQRLMADVERLRIENERLRHDADRLRTDPAAVEDVARRELGLIRPGELVFLVVDK
jgi:cell division protein FtsB